MQCTSGYPCKYEDLNLKVIAAYKELFPDAIIGYSGHDNGIAMPVAAYALGARMIEKHFTLDRSLKGTDHAFSLERPGLEKMVRDLRRARVAMGDGIKKPIASEHAPLVKMQKCLVAARPLPAGHTITKTDIPIKSPGDGLLPYHYDFVLGAVTTKPIGEEEKITYESLNVKSPVLTAPRTLRERVERVRIAAFDFDGVFTDNKVYVDQNGVETVACTRADGMGLERLRDVGVETVVISSEVNAVVAARCKKLGLHCIHGTRDKLTELTRFARERGVGLEQVAFVGNDLNDLACLQAVGLPIAVHDAHPSAKQAAVVVTDAAGGQGCVREVCDFVAARLAKVQPAVKLRVA
jgi:YrbI family 3-deoxy-D-manno-octulosonate 8-phosphate phosphatase